MKVVLLLPVAIALGGLHQGLADLNAEMVALGLQRRQLQQKKASSATNIEMDGQVGMLEQLLRRREFQRQLKKAAEGIDVLAHQSSADATRGAWRSKPQQAV